MEQIKTIVQTLWTYFFGNETNYNSSTNVKPLKEEIETFPNIENNIKEIIESIQLYLK